MLNRTPFVAALAGALVGCGHAPPAQQPEPTLVAPEQLDTDGDDIADELDQCVDQPEDQDEFEDDDGCPDDDNDGDLIADADDLCPDDPEELDAFEDEDGCPDPDNDQDRILDDDDQCPNEPEVYNGITDEDGCPDEGQIAIFECVFPIIERIFFGSNNAHLRPPSMPVLDAVAATMIANPDIVAVGVVGYADRSERAPETVAAARSDAVIAALVARHVPRERLVPLVGGSRAPIDPSGSSEAAARNRRAEFHVLKDSGGVVADWDVDAGVVRARN